MARPLLVPNYGQLTQVDIPGNIRADRQLDLQRAQLSQQRHAAARRDALAKQELDARIADQRTARMLEAARLRQGQGTSARQGVNLMSGQPRYFQDPAAPDSAPVEAFVDERSGVPIMRTGQPVPQQWRNVTADVTARRAERDLERAVRKEQAINWEKNRAGMRTDAQAVSANLLEDLSVVDSTIDSLQGVATGPGADIISVVDKVKSFVGIEVAPSSPSKAKEYMQAYKNRIASKYFADQKGGLNEKEFTAIMEAAPDIHKTAEGNMMLLEVERAVADWKIRRNLYQRELLSNLQVGSQEYDRKLRKWDLKHSEKIIPMGLKARIRKEQAKAKRISYKDIWATGSTPTVPSAAPTPGGGGGGLVDMESLMNELNQ